MAKTLPSSPSGLNFYLAAGTRRTDVVAGRHILTGLIHGLEINRANIEPSS